MKKQRKTCRCSSPFGCFSSFECSSSLESDSSAKNSGDKAAKLSLMSMISCLIICACLFLTACQGKGSDGGSSEPEGIGINASDTSAAEQERHTGKEWAYVPEIISVEDDRASYEDMQLLGDTVCYISMSGEAEGENQKICRYSLSQRELTQVSIHWPLKEKTLEICSFVFNPDYSVWLIVNAYSADFSQLKRYLCRLDAEGQNMVTQDITQEMGRGSYVGQMALDGQGRIYVFTSEFAEPGETGMWLYTADGQYHGSLDYGTPEAVLVKGTVNGADGRFYLCVSVEEGHSMEESPNHCTMLEVDFDEKKLTEIIPDFPNINGLCTGEQYDLLLYDDKHVYRYDFPSHKSGSGQPPEELFTWTDSDINGYFVKHLSVLEDGRYYAAVEDWMTKDRCIVLLRRTKAEDAVPRKDIALAAVNGDSGLTALAVKFNRSQEQYHVDIKNYDSLTNLYNAILTKEPMDIIDLSGVNVESLSRQGIFEDLRPYLEQSESFAPSDFVDGILDTYTIDDALIGIPESFALRTVVGDRTLLGEEVALTLEGLLEIAERNPGALPMGEVTKEEMLQYIMMFNQDAFIDWETGKCRFDSEPFKAVLEFVKRFPDSLETTKEEASLPAKIADGRVLFAIADFHSLGNFQRYEGMFGETAACVGFPTPEGKGGTLLSPTNAFGITSMSQYKDGAWEFIESVLEPNEIEKMEPRKILEMYQIPNTRFPSLKRILNILIEYELEEDRIWAEKGRNFGFLTYPDGWIIEFHALTREEIDTILVLAKDARPYFSAGEDEIIKIIGEEAPACYSGQKSPEDVAKIIQNRVQLYVDENR